MTLVFFVFISLGIVAAAIIQCKGPSAFRTGFFFGVTVDPEFARTEEARRIVWGYRRPIIIMAVICIAALWFAVPRLSGVAAPLTASAIVMIDVMAGMVSMAATARHVRPFAKVQDSTRTASLTPRTKTLPGGWLPFAGPILILGAVRWWLFARQASIPPAAYRGALSLLLIGFVASALCMWVGWLVAFRMRSIRSSTENGVTRRLSYWSRMLLAYYFVVFAVTFPVFQALGMSPDRAAARSLPIILLSFVGLAVMIVTLVVKAQRVRGTSPEAGIGDNTPEGCWKYGMFYYNPDDPAFVVESRLGPLGCDMNLGNRWSWVVSLGLVALPILLRLIWF